MRLTCLHWIMIAIAAQAAVSEVARACSCFPDVNVALPGAATHPEGAPFIVRSSCGGAPGSFSAIVDGETVRTIRQAAFDGGFANYDAFVLDPMPPVGADVVLLSPCGELEESCDGLAERARYVIGPVDTEGPPQVADVAVITEEVSAAAEGECLSPDGDLRIIAKVELGDRDPDALVEVEFRRRGDVLRTQVHEMPENGTVESSHFADLAGELGEVCARARLRDSSGNVSPWSEDCESLGGCGCSSDAGAPPWIAILVVPWLVRRRTSRRSAG